MQSLRTAVCRPALSPIKRVGVVRTAPSVRTMASKVDTIKQTVEENKVVVYSKTYCPYCSEVKGLMSKLNVPAKVFELDQMSDGAELQAGLLELTGQRTVPQVFVARQHVGGCTDTMKAYENGELKMLMEEAGIAI